MRKTVFFLGVVIVAAWIFLWYAKSPDTNEQSISQNTFAGEKIESYSLKTLNQTSEKPVKERETETEATVSTGYAYSCLTEEEQRLYEVVLSGLEKMKTEVEVPTLDEKMLDKVFSCVMGDHPEIFYVNGYRYNRYTQDGVLTKMTFRGDYIYTQQEISKMQEQIDKRVTELLQRIEKNASDYEKVKYVYDTIVEEIEYELDAPDSQNICSVFINGKSVCQGYAKATQYLLGKLGVDSFLVTGTVKTGENHAWNLVKVDNNWYYLDTTWGDAYYKIVDTDIKEGESPTANYDYFCVTTEQISRTHVAKSKVTLPECTSMDANYFVMEGAYFTEYDSKKMKLLFERAKEESRKFIMVKCASIDVYRELYEEMIEKQEVFSYMPEGQATISYTNNEEQRSISFWL